MRVYRDLVKHSSIYGLGQILARVASILLLPVYTHYLRPADYGVIAILDLLAGLLAILVGSGMAAAVNRFHFENDSQTQRSCVWWTGFGFVVLTASTIVLPSWLARRPFAHLMLGTERADGAWLVALALTTVWFNCIGELPDTYLRTRKWSSLSVTFSLIRLSINVALNVSLLVLFDMGVAGILLGNLVTGAIMTLVLSCTMLWHEQPIAIDFTLLKKLIAFGSPLIFTAILATVMHQADRYLLRLFLDMRQVGLYSLAYQIGQGVNSLCLIPFGAIWSAAIYEIAATPDAKRIYASVFEYFVYGLALALLAASLFAEPLLKVLTAPDYGDAARLIPIVCLAYFFFSLHAHFRVPVLLAKCTLNLISVYFVAAAVNIASNVVLIPWLGAAGAAWASVLTFATFSFFGLTRYRRIDRYPYPLLRCGKAVVGLVLTYVACRQIAQFSATWAVAFAAISWVGWAILLLGSVVFPCLSRILSPRCTWLLESMFKTTKRDLTA